MKSPHVCESWITSKQLINNLQGYSFSEESFQDRCFVSQITVWFVLSVNLRANNPILNVMWRVFFFILYLQLRASCKEKNKVSSLFITSSRFSLNNIYFGDKVMPISRYIIHCNSICNGERIATGKYSIFLIKVFISHMRFQR